METEKGWSKLTPEQKREIRFNRWLEAPGVKFTNATAKKAYRERVTRLSKALLLQEPDRVPVQLPSGNFPAYYAGGTLHQVMYDYNALRRAWIKFIHDFDMDTYRGPSLVHSGRVMEMLDYKLYKWPGHGLDLDVKGYQFVEGEYMKADEYDAMMKDPSDFSFRIVAPRVSGTLEPFKRFAPFSSMMGRPINMVSTFTHPEVRAAFQALINAGIEMSKWQEAVRTCDQEALAIGLPNIQGGTAAAPFDTIGDALRGTQGIMLDMYRQPEKLLEAMDFLADLNIERTIAGVNASGGVMVWFALHKGDDTFMSPKQFEKFYWPGLKKVIMALIKEGIMVSLFAEGKYQMRLEIIKDLPKGWAMWHFDQTDMAVAKKVLGNTACIAGNVPTSLLCTGTPKDVKIYCRKLIDTCAPGGGFLLTGGASATETNAANLRAMMEVAKEYGRYK
jgi:Uroporphyrinogen decarboxylase (URO-D)